MFKYISFLSILWAGAATAASPKYFYLDFSQPATEINYNDNDIWDRTYDASSDYRAIYFGNELKFRLSHCNTGFGGEDIGGMSYWDGFTISRNGDHNNYGAPGNSDGWVSHQWGSMAGGGVRLTESGYCLAEDGLGDVSCSYAVGYWSGDRACNRIDFVGKEENATFTVEEIYINIHPWPYYGILDGDGFARAFTEEKDFFSLTIHGLGDNGVANGKSVTHQFVEMRQLSPQEYVPEMSTGWERIDLTSLGKVSGIFFTMDSSDVNPSFGINTAAYFCLGGMTVGNPLYDASGIEAVIDTTVIEPIEWFTLEGRRISSPTSPGIYIRRTGGNVEKIRITDLFLSRH